MFLRVLLGLLFIRISLAEKCIFSESPLIVTSRDCPSVDLKLSATKLDDVKFIQNIENGSVCDSSNVPEVKMIYDGCQIYHAKLHIGQENVTEIMDDEDIFRFRLPKLSQIHISFDGSKLKFDERFFSLSCLAGKKPKDQKITVKVEFKSSKCNLKLVFDKKISLVYTFFDFLADHFFRLLLTLILILLVLTLSICVYLRQKALKRQKEDFIAREPSFNRSRDSDQPRPSRIDPNDITVIDPVTVTPITHKNSVVLELRDVYGISELQGSSKRQNSIDGEDEIIVKMPGGKEDEGPKAKIWKIIDRKRAEEAEKGSHLTVTPEENENEFEVAYSVTPDGMENQKMEPGIPKIEEPIEPQITVKNEIQKSSEQPQKDDKKDEERPVDVAPPVPQKRSVYSQYSEVSEEEINHKDNRKAKKLKKKNKKERQNSMRKSIRRKPETAPKKQRCNLIHGLKKRYARTFKKIDEEGERK
ncbi:unnamed protein product [Bursaphelenchus xylophilus]|uniref:(pine wood nematode) hypothetical protein n=1 Tax=Bursaphelenchus xylophilus TaxID=6326 RepID=A0A1I7RLP7_BURXY|nr:unnamed protein product [Bursaphelenchus xylophilus]CAG9082728.1 unnamed protein product [Bursaphelenchus xylophilus]